MPQRNPLDDSSIPLAAQRYSLPYLCQMLQQLPPQVMAIAKSAGEGPVRGSPRYLCLRHERTGACDRNAVSQAELLDRMVAALQEQVLAPHNVARIKAAIRKRLASEVDRVDATALNRQLATVEAKLAKARRRLVEVERDLLGVVQDEVRRLLGEQERLQAAIKAAQTPRRTQFADIVQKLDAAIAVLGRVRAVVEEGNPMKVRELLRQWIDHVEVHAVSEQRGKRRLFRLQRGAFYLKNLFATTASRGS